MTHFPSRSRRPLGPAHRGSAGAERAPESDVVWGRPIFRAPRLVLRPSAPASPFAGSRPPTPQRRGRDRSS